MSNIRQIFSGIRTIAAAAICVASVYPMIGAAQSQSFPSKPIRVIVGFPAGTNPDIVMRAVGTEMAKRLGQPIIQEPKPGANSTIAARYVASSPADGYTLFFGAATSPHPIFNKNNAIDLSREMASVSQVVTTPLIVASKASLPANTVSELAAYAKSQGRQLRYGTQSPVVNLVMEMLKQRTGIVAEPIPYKGSPQIMTALLAEEIDLSSGGAQSYVSQIEAGRVRALFVMSAKRYSLLPSAPTSKEFGISDLELAVNWGLWAPSGTPRSAIVRISTEVASALKEASVANQLRAKLGAEPVGSTPDEQLRATQAELSLWLEAARSSGFQPE